MQKKSARLSAAKTWISHSFANIDINNRGRLQVTASHLATIPRTLLTRQSHHSKVNFMAARILNRNGVVLAFAGYIVMGTIAIGMALAWPEHFFIPYLGQFGLGIEVLAGLGAGLAIILVGWLADMRMSASQEMTRLLGRALTSLLLLPEAVPVPLRRVLPVVVLLSIVTGLAEEALFRGVLWEGLSGPLSVPGTLIVTSLIFGASHGLWRKGMRFWGLYATLSGLALGGLRAWSGGLVAPVIAHILIDAVDIPMTLKQSKAIRSASI